MPAIRRPLAILVAALSGTVGVSTLYAAGGNAPHRSAAHATGQVQIKEINGKYQFLPPTIQVTAGDTVNWTNNSDAPHTVTSDTGSFNTQQFGEDKTVTLTFRTAGTFPYHCSIHPYMHGTIVVKAATGGIPSGVSNTGGGSVFSQSAAGLPHTGGAAGQSGRGTPLLPVGGLLGALMVAAGVLLRRLPLAGRPG